MRFLDKTNILKPRFKARMASLPFPVLRRNRELKSLFPTFAEISIWIMSATMSMPGPMAIWSKPFFLTCLFNVKQKSEIPGYLFRTPEAVFQSASNPENRCYCSPNLPPGWCEELDGFSMMDQCQFGAPAIASAPHFLSASQFFFDKLDGLGNRGTSKNEKLNFRLFPTQKNPSTRSMFPMWSMNRPQVQLFTMPSDSRFERENFSEVFDFFFQVNFLLTPNKQLEFMTLEEPIPMPMFWLNETMMLDEGTTADMYEKSIKPMKIVTSLQYSLFALGGLLVLLGLVDGSCKAKSKNISDPSCRKTDFLNSSKNPNLFRQNRRR